MPNNSLVIMISFNIHKIRNYALNTVIGIVRTMRPKQWTKNLLFVFPPIIFDGQLFNVDALSRVIVAFIALCFISGTVYIINDIVDVESDRKHPKKRFRPIAAGEVSIKIAVVSSIFIPIITLSFVLFSFQSTPLAITLVIYLVIQLLYSFYLKHIVIVDVLIITIGFVLRVVAGSVVFEVTNFSPWLYVCTGLLALFLIVAKRRQELILLGEDIAGDVRPIFKHYNLALLDEMLRIVTTSTLITYILYTVETPSELNESNAALVTIPFVMYGLFRYLYLIYVKGETSPPDEVLLKDRLMQFDIILFGIVVMLILYL